MFSSISTILTPNEMEKLLAERFKVLRLRAGLKRTTLAQRAGVIVAGEGRAPDYKHFAALAEAFSISAKEMKMMICEVFGAVERWPEFAEKAGVSAVKIRYIAGFFAFHSLNHQLKCKDYFTFKLIYEIV